VSDVEVDQDPDMLSAQAHVGEQLSVVYSMNCLHALHFDNYKILDHQIQPVSEFDFFAVINDR